MQVTDLIRQIQSSDPAVRTAAWQQAGEVGAPAVKPLAELCTHEQQEVRRAAKRGLERIVRTLGAPGIAAPKAAVIGELLDLLGDSHTVALRRDVLWLLSEIAGNESVEPVAALLAHRDLREDARMVLERIPGDKSLGVLRQALGTVPANFRLNIAQSLRARGQVVDTKTYPCQKLVPTK